MFNDDFGKTSFRAIRRKVPADSDKLRDFFKQAWGEPIMVTGGKLRHLDECETLVQ